MRYFLFVLLLILLVGDNQKARGQQQGGKWVLVFSDEFNQKKDSRPDTTKWSVPKPQNNIWRRWVSDSPAVAYISKGKLICKAIPQRGANGAHKMITGAIDTQDKFSFKYGRVDVRMRTNIQPGNFPAAWLMPQPDGKPYLYGEIDIVETFGSKAVAHHTAHTHWDVNLKRKSNNEFHENLDVTKWHVYSVVWEPEQLTWLVDGKVMGVYRKSSSLQDLKDGQWTFDRPFFIRLNQSVGDNTWKERPDYSRTFRTEFDWVRVYQRK